LIIRDIVDTTPWNGNVWKMLLGAINDTYDLQDEEPKRYSTITQDSARS
jgi:hypothetical protein